MSSTSPSFLTHSARSLRQVVEHPRTIAEAIGYALVWVLALVSMVRLLGETLKHRYDVWTAQARRRFPRVAAVGHATAGWIVARPIVAIGVVFVVNSIVMALIEPDFGINGEALRLIGSTAIAVAANTIGARLLAVAVARRLWDIPATIRPAGWSIPIGVAGLALSRALRFVPGLLEGGATEMGPLGRIHPGEDGARRGAAGVAVAGHRVGRLVRGRRRSRRGTPRGRF